MIDYSTVDVEKIKRMREAEAAAAMQREAPGHFANSVNTSLNEPMPAPTPHPITVQPPDPREVRAYDYEKQARPPAPPVGTKEKLIDAIGGGLGAFANPHGYQQVEMQKKEFERQREQDLYGRAKELRGEVAQSNQQRIEQQRYSAESDWRNKQAGITERHYQDEAAHQRAQEQQAGENATNKIEFAPPGSQPFKGGQPMGLPIPKEPAATNNEDEKINLLKVKKFQHPDQWTPANEQELKDRVGTKLAIGTNTFNLNNPSGDTNTVKYMADQVEDNPLNWNMLSNNKALSEQVRQELTSRGRDVNRLTASTRQLGESADAVVPKIDNLIKRLDDPKFIENLGPIMGRWNEFWTGKIGTNDPDLAAIRAEIGLTQTGVMRAHVGARGGTGLLEKFESLADGTKMDAATLKGSLGGMREFLQGYRDRIHPRGATDTTISQEDFAKWKASRPKK